MSLLDAAKQALEALAQARDYTTHGQIAWNCMEAINNLRAAIEEAEKSEPACVIEVSRYGKRRIMKAALPVGCHHLYTHPTVVGKLTPFNTLNAASNQVTTAPTIPAGFQLVPIEPTEEMLDKLIGINRFGLCHTYRLMLAAAPKQEGEQ